MLIHLYLRLQPNGMRTLFPSCVDPQLVDPLRACFFRTGPTKRSQEHLHFPWVLLKIGYPMAEIGHLDPEEDDKLTDLGEPIFGQSHLTGGYPDWSIKVYWSETASLCSIPSNSST